MGNKIQTTLLRDIAFKNVLPLNEDVLWNIRCTKQVFGSEQGDMFTVALVTKHSEVILSSAKIFQFKGQDSEDSLRFYEACKFYLSYVIMQKPKKCNYIYIINI